MNSFDDKRDGAETQFAFQEKQSFEIEARACKIFGLWVAEKFSLEGADAQTYARTVIEANLEEPGFEDVLRKVRRDLDEKGIAYEDEALFKNLDKALLQAKTDLSKS